MFEREFKRYQALAYKWACDILGDGPRAEDAAQEAFLAAYRSRRQLRQPAAFGAWLKRIVRSQCTRVLRRRAEIVEVDVELLPAREPDPGQRSERQALADRLRQVIGQLPPHQAKVVGMFYLEGCALADISRQLQVPEGAVKKRLFDARKRLRLLLAEDEWLG